MSNVYGNVFRADAKRILRDPFLLMMIFYLPPINVLLRWGVPKLTETVQKTVDLVAYYPLIAAMMVLTVPFIFGAVLGMQMLGEKDENSMTAIVVTPFSFHRYFAARVVLYSLMGAILTVGTHYILGIVTQVSLLKLILVAMVLSLNTPIAALVIASVAKNQVQGFAVLKGSGLLISGPALSFFLPAHWDMLVGIIPLYWPLKAYFLAATGGSEMLFWVALAVGVVGQAITVHFLYKLFCKNILLT